MEIRAWTLLNELAARIPSVREPIASLSGGQRQTVAIARSLLLDPKLIMLDEPTAALGVAQTAEVLNLIERVRDRGLGVIMISHNMEDVRAVADRIVVLRLGRNNGVFYPRRVEPGTGQRHHRGGRQRGLAPVRPAAGAAGTHPGGSAVTDHQHSTRRTPARPGGRPRPRGHRPRRRHSRLLRPRALGRPRLAAGGRRPRHHLVGVPGAEPDLPVQQQPRQPAVRLLDGGRDLARHRLHPDGRRDRPVGRLGQRLRLGGGRRAVGERGLAGLSSRSWSRWSPAPRSASSTPCCSTAWACRASCRRWPACSRCSGSSSTSWAPAARSTCPTARRW